MSTTISNEIMQDILRNSSQNSIAWDRMRIGKFTASSVWKLMGDPRSKSDRESGKLSATAESYIVEKAMEEITGISANESFGRAIDHGNEWEETALSELRKVLGDPNGFTMKPAMALFNEYSGASADAIIPEEKIGVEIKCPFNSVNHYYHTQVVDAESLKEIAPEYYWQILMNMISYRYTRWIFASFDPRMPEGKRIHFTYIDPLIDDLNDLCYRLERAEDRKRSIVESLK